jgi:hypothetical protein
LIGEELLLPQDSEARIYCLQAPYEEERVLRRVKGNDRVNEKQQLIEHLAHTATEILLDDGAPADPQGLLTAATDLVVLEWEKLLGSRPDKVNPCLVMQAAIVATHGYLLKQAHGLGLLYTFGYTMPCAEAVIEQLVALSVVITDIRFSANSRAAKWRKNRLQAQLLASYLHLPELGNENYNRPGAPIQLARPEIGVNLVGERLQQGQHLAFMCVCSDIERCHRKVAAGLMLEQFPTLNVIHL